MKIKPTAKTVWQGRIDDKNDRNSYRWHQCLQSTPANSGLSLLGFACDVGVAHNHGRTGAKKAPDKIKAMMANLPANSRYQRHLFDAGNIVIDDTDLATAQQALGKQLAALLPQSGRTIVLGGGHETAWGSFMGLAEYAKQQKLTPRIGIINFDAHFDLRDDTHTASSGTPFLQISRWCQKHDWDFHYACLGVSETANTKTLFDTADQLQVWYCYDSEMTLSALPKIHTQLQDFIKQVDWLYVTIDLDVLPAAVAPGVSAPAALGVDLCVIEALLKTLVSSGKLQLADIVECNPTYDIDNRTARVAARLAYYLSQ